MLVELRSLRPNPLRDFRVDPVDKDRVSDLKTSIQEDGFWGGVVCRQTKKGIEIAAGHHRVEAAIGAGIKSADVFVSDDMDDATLIRVYSRENATQRGNTATAQAGTIAAAIHFLSKHLATGNLAQICARLTKRGLETAKGEWEKGDGIGTGLILEFLGHGIPGVNEAMVRQQLSNLKSSGEYARIVGEVQEEIEEEEKVARVEAERKEREARAAQAEAAKREKERKEAQEREKAAKDEAERKRAEADRERAEADARLAEKRKRDAEKEMEVFEAKKQAATKATGSATKAATTASKTEITFDQVGVSKYLKVASHLAEFRRLVTSPGVQPYVRVDHQERLAKELWEEYQAQHAKNPRVEFTVAFMRDNIITLARYGRTQQQRVNKEEQEQRDRQSLVSKYSRLVEEFDTALRSVYNVGQQLIELEKHWPKGLAKPISKRLIDDVEAAWKIISNLKRAL